MFPMPPRHRRLPAPMRHRPMTTLRHRPRAPLYRFLQVPMHRRLLGLFLASTRAGVRRLAAGVPVAALRLSAAAAPVALRLWAVSLTAVALGWAPASAQISSGSTATGVSNTLNPAISVNSLFVGRTEDPSTEAQGFKAQEVELALTAIVDPNFKANAFVAYEPDPAGPDTEVSLEEVYIQATRLPAGWGLRAGRMFLPFGRHNQLHTHAFPFVEAPLAVDGVLGPESQGDVGVELTYAPDLPWYLNLRAFVGDGATGDLFDGASRELAAAVRAEALWDLGESATFELGGSVLDGPDAGTDRRTLVGADVRIKWKDPRRTYGHAFVWTTEVLIDARDVVADQVGVYTFAQYRLSRRWWTGGGYSLLSRVPFRPGADRGNDHELKGQLAYVFSEFSDVRIDVAWRDRQDAQRELEAVLQLNFTIGSHPAHSY